MTSIKKSEDGTIRINFEDGYSTVIIPTINDKNTICVSSQAGCPIGCKFCHTKFFNKNLSKEEILNQIEIAKQYCEKITSIVFMGCGEPMLNFDQVNQSIKLIHEKYKIAYKKITLSTIGLNLDKLIDKKYSVAISLHSPIDKIRQELINKKTNVKDIVEFCKNRKQPTMIAYSMIKDINDKDEDLKELLKLDFPSQTNFNLIEFNETNEYKSSNRLEYFKEEIRKKGYKCFIRQSRGKDISAACGMLTFNTVL